MYKVIRAIQVITTWQGEAKDSGSRMLLVRFKHCNRADNFEGKSQCPFCDTVVSMRNFAESEYHISVLQELIDSEKLVGPLITGGEPTFGANLNQSILMLNGLKYKLANVETNGFNLTELISQVNKNKPVNYFLSPKIFDNDDLSFYMGILENLLEYNNIYIKLVFQGTPYNYDLLDFLNKNKFESSRIFLMPEGKTREELIDHSPIVFEACEKFKTSFSSRDHIIYNFI